MSLNCDCLITPVFHQQKETTMPIDKRKFYSYAINITAEDLSNSHIGALVTVTTDQGVVVTDVLTGIIAGEPFKYPSKDKGSKVYVTLANTGFTESWETERRSEGALLEPLSRVKVKYPVAE